MHREVAHRHHHRVPRARRAVVPRWEGARFRRRIRWERSARRERRERLAVALVRRGLQAVVLVRREQVREPRELALVRLAPAVAWGFREPGPGLGVLAVAAGHRSWRSTLVLRPDRAPICSSVRSCPNPGRRLFSPLRLTRRGTQVDRGLQWPFQRRRSPRPRRGAAGHRAGSSTLPLAVSVLAVVRPSCLTVCAGAAAGTAAAKPSTSTDRRSSASWSFTHPCQNRP